MFMLSLKSHTFSNQYYNCIEVCRFHMKYVGIYYEHQETRDLILVH